MFLIRPATIDDDALVSSDVPESEAVYNPATSYAADVVVRGNTTDTEHRTFQSLVGSNVGNALTEPTKWLAIGATNRWKMFDKVVSSQTENADSIAVVLTAPGRVDSVALHNVSASSLHVEMTDATDGVVFSETRSLISTSGIDDFWKWLFEPITRIKDAVVTGLPPYAGAEIAITLTDTGNTAKCGVLDLGLSRQIGLTQYGATVGVRDFSRKDQDIFGTIVPVERPFSKRASFTDWFDPTDVDAVQDLLATYRATPITYVGSTTYGATVLIAYFRDFNIELAGPTHALCTIDLEGLT